MKLHEQFLLALVVLVVTILCLSLTTPELVSVSGGGGDEGSNGAWSSAMRMVQFTSAGVSNFSGASFSTSSLLQLPLDAWAALPNSLSLPPSSSLLDRCIPSDPCIDTLTRFYLENGDGFFVGESGALKWLTNRMGPTLVDLARVQAGGRVVALDLGAGKYGSEGSSDDSDSLLLLGEVCQLNQNCEVHAFEAIPQKAKQLGEEVVRRAKTKAFAENYFVHQMAISNASSGTVKLYPPGSAKSLNNYKVASSNDELSESSLQNAIDVPVTNLDTFLESRGLMAPGAVSYVKIDIEGGEMNALYGARKALELGAISMLSFEYGFQWTPASRRISLGHANRKKMRTLILEREQVDIFTPEGSWKHGPMEPREIFGDKSLLHASRFLDSLGFDVYLLNSRRKEKHAPVLVPVSHGHFLEPMSELCLYEPSIFDLHTSQPVTAAIPAARSRGTVRNCWTDAIAVRRGEPKRVFFEAFAARSREKFGDCNCL